MKRYLVALSLSLPFGGFAQHPVIQAALNAVSIDTLVNDIEQLTGEVPVDVANGPVTILAATSSTRATRLRKPGWSSG